MEEEEQSREREKCGSPGAETLAEPQQNKMPLSLSVAVFQAMRTRGRSAAVPEWI